MGNPCRYIWSEPNFVGKPTLNKANKTITVTTYGISPGQLKRNYSQVVCDFYSAPDVILAYKNGNTCKDEWRRYSRTILNNLLLVAYSGVESDGYATFKYTDFECPRLTEEEMYSNIPLGKFMNMTYEQVKEYRKINVPIFAKDLEVSQPGYHVAEIPRGEYGKISKIIEEAAELKDAMEQGQKLMCLIELSDILGAIEGYLEKEYEGKVTVTDLFNMSNATKRAFESGGRK